MHERVDPVLEIHVQNPNTILNTIPDFAKHDRENPEQKAGPIAAGHNKVLALASECYII